MFLLEHLGATHGLSGGVLRLGCGPLEHLDATHGLSGGVLGLGGGLFEHRKFRLCQLCALLSLGVLLLPFLLSFGDISLPLLLRTNEGTRGGQLSLSSHGLSLGLFGLSFSCGVPRLRELLFPFLFRLEFVLLPFLLRFRKGCELGVGFGDGVSSRLLRLGNGEGSRLLCVNGDLLSLGERSLRVRPDAFGGPVCFSDHLFSLGELSVSLSRRALSILRSLGCCALGVS